MRPKKLKKTAIFIDDANLFYAQKRIGWKISWDKYKNYLLKHYDVRILNYYIGQPLSEKGKKETKKIITKLKKLGFFVKTKPLKKIWTGSKKSSFIYKCNFDVEIGLDVARCINQVENIIIVSGDSDFIAIKDFCLKKHKTFLVICFENNVAWEIRKIHHLFFEDIKDEIIKK